MRLFGRCRKMIRILSLGVARYTSESEAVRGQVLFALLQLYRWNVRGA